MRTYALILAGGTGSRMSSDINKVFIPLNGVPVIVRAIAPFSALVSGAVVVTHADEQREMQELIAKYGLYRFVKAIVAGGKTRQESVACGLAALPSDADAVLVHDGARPFVSEAIISRVISSVMEHGSGVAAMPVTDTVKLASDDGLVENTLDRSRIYLMQTPQGFKVDELKRAHELALSEGCIATDDAALLERAGFPVYLVHGEADNIKLTNPDDILRAEAIMIVRNRIGAEL